MVIIGDQHRVYSPVCLPVADDSVDPFKIEALFSGEASEPLIS